MSHLAFKASSGWVMPSVAGSIPAVAVKLLKPTGDVRDSSLLQGERLERFKREARVAQDLSRLSTHIAHVHYIDEDEQGQWYIIIELLAGTTLQKRLAQPDRLSTAEALRIIEETADALQVAHDAGVVHRDLKPENIFLADQGERSLVEVIDFGIARAYDASSSSRSPLTAEGTLIGTPVYMSPEQISERPVDYRTDLWALAMIAFECFTGRRAFHCPEAGRAEWFLVLVEDICRSPPPIPSQVAKEAGNQVPRGLDAWFARAASRGADHRCPSALELFATLREACDSGRARDPVSWRQVWARRILTVAAGATVLVTAALAVSKRRRAVRGRRPRGQAMFCQRPSPAGYTTSCASRFRLLAASTGPWPGLGHRGCRCARCVPRWHAGSPRNW